MKTAEKFQKKRTETALLIFIPVMFMAAGIRGILPLFY